MLYMLFIDFERAFDLIKRYAIWTALKNVVESEKIIANFIRMPIAACSSKVQKAINFK